METTRTAGSDFINKSFTIDAASAIGTTTLIAAVAGKRLIVTDLEISTDAANKITVFHSAAATSINRIGGGFFPASGGLHKDLADYPVKNPTVVVVGEAVSVTFTAVSNVVITAIYHEE